MYAFENRCLEELGLPLGDRSRVIILNTKGTTGEVSEDLKELLHYMDAPRRVNIPESLTGTLWM